MDPKHSLGPDRIDYKETPGDLTDVHAAIEREHPEPSADVTPIPMWLTGVCGFAIACAGVYLGMFHGGFRGDVFNERSTSPGQLFVTQSKQMKSETPIGPKTLADQGKAVYGLCAACHGPSGGGSPGVFPPLAKSEWVVGSEKRLVGIILKGLQGPITVAGKQYTNVMPPQEAALSDLKVAAVASYVRANFGNSAPEITEAKVAAARAEFASRGMFTEAELLQIPEDATLQGGGVPSGGAPATGALPGAAGGQAAQADKVVPGAATPTSPADTRDPAAKPTNPPAAPPAKGQPAAPGSGTQPSNSPGLGATAPGNPSVPPAQGTPAAAAPNPADKQNFMAYGQQQYMVCLPCHQANGQGMPGAFPPLAGTEYVNGSAERFAAMILKGNMGPITVNGQLFNSMMPPLEAALKDDQIAAIMTYVRASFGNNAPPVAPDVVAAARKKYAARTTSWTEAELKAWK